MMDILKKPAGMAVLALIAGFGLGLLWGWVVQPVEWTGADPSFLQRDYRVDYLRMAIDSYGQNSDEDLAIQRFRGLGASAPAALQTVQRNPGKQDPSAILGFGDAVQDVIFELETQASTETTTSAGFSSPLVIGSIIALLLVLGVGGYYLARLLRPNNTSGEKTAAMQARELSNSVERTDYTSMGDQQPIAQFVTTYVLGDDLFDDSFSVDSPAGEFLGECGVGISDTIGVGDPKKVTAFEVWMFDKNDIQTITKVLMSAHAFNDPNVRGKLESKGELMQIGPGAKVMLETATLQMMATVSDMQYGQSALPQNSYFDRLTLELAIWPKQK